jgi:hypothetical protein
MSKANTSGTNTNTSEANTNTSEANDMERHISEKLHAQVVKLFSNGIRSIEPSVENVEGMVNELLTSRATWSEIFFLIGLTQYYPGDPEFVYDTASDTLITKIYTGFFNRPIGMDYPTFCNSLNTHTIQKYIKEKYQSSNVKVCCQVSFGISDSDEEKLAKMYINSVKNISAPIMRVALDQQEVLEKVIRLLLSPISFLSANYEEDMGKTIDTEMLEEVADSLSYSVLKELYGTPELNEKDYVKLVVDDEMVKEYLTKRWKKWWEVIEQSENTKSGAGGEQSARSTRSDETKESSGYSRNDTTFLDSDDEMEEMDKHVCRMMI